MSLLTDVLNSMLSKNAENNAPVQGQGQADVLVNAALDLLERAGGVEGVVRKFQNSGLGDLVASWVGTGQNKGVTPDQITQALGQDNVEVIAQQANLPTAQGGDILSELLPVLIDRLTPEGRVPDQEQLVNLGKTLLGGLSASGLFSETTKT
jgi:uncharacterized protein YidB (DUF937 family)